MTDRAKIWALRIFVVAVGLVITAELFELQPASWWSQSGLPAHPGNFIAREKINYPICVPWRSDAGDSAFNPLKVNASADGLHMTEGHTAEPVAGGGQTNVGLLLPRTATVRKVYCAVQVSPAPEAECSWERCAPSLTFLANDDLYTRGRALTFTLRNLAPTAADPAHVRIWALWTRKPDD